MLVADLAKLSLDEVVISLWLLSKVSYLLADLPCGILLSTNENSTPSPEMMINAEHPKNIPPTVDMPQQIVHSAGLGNLIGVMPQYLVGTITAPGLTPERIARAPGAFG